MPLEEYRRKRDFGRTPEPAGDRPPVAAGRRYVIQKHAARRLHYDIRLEHDGVLLSWALPKGPSLDPAEKRLAVQTEDHPIEYGDFEGLIPPGEYGGGTVMLWDRGTWEPITPFPDSLREGQLKFHVHGTKLRGAWALIRLGGEGNESGRNWLLIKEKDEAVVREQAGCITNEAPFSVISGRSMRQIEEHGDVVWTAGAARARPPAATGSKSAGVEAPMPDPFGIGELPGAQRRKRPRTLTVQRPSRSPAVPAGEDWLHEMLWLGQRLLCVLDGHEVTLCCPDGQDLTARLPRVAVAAAGLPLDVAMVDGLLVLLDDHGVSNPAGLRNALQHGHGDGLLYFACDLPYAQGYDLRRTPLWQRKEMLQRTLSAAPFAESALRYSDHIRGDGATVFEHARKLGAAGIVSKRAESSYVGRRSRDWLVVHCGSSAAECQAAAAPAQASTKAELEVRQADDAAAMLPAPRCRVAGVQLTNPQRILYPEEHISKRFVALFYEAIAAWALPHLLQRPLSLYRCPKGVENDGFFHKHLDEAISAHLHGVMVSKSSEKKPFIIIKDAPGLVTLVQMSVLEIHPWGSRIDQPDKPDRMILDLDPGPDVPWSAIVEGALQIREVLQILGLQSWVKTTGGKGLHVVVPLQRRSNWDDVKRFSQSVAQFMVRHDPTRYVFTISKAQRPGKILIDYLRNTRGATAVAPYSTRARPGAAVSTPLAWDELDPKRRVQFDVRTLLRRLARIHHDPWEGFLPCRQVLTARMKEQLDAQR